jgi:hypothetical protein
MLLSHEARIARIKENDKKKPKFYVKNKSKEEDT